MRPSLLAFVLFFWLLLAADCIFILMELEQFRFITMGLLMPVLYLLLLNQTAGTRHKRSRFIISLVLIFSWLGGILLFKSDLQLNFIAGLSFFLLAHLFYAAFFLRIAPFRQRYLLMLFFSGFIILICFSLFLLILSDRFEGFLLPVIILSFIMSFMLLTAINTINYSRFKKIGAQYFVPGAIFFMVSDAVLLIDRFNLLDSSGVWIMTTYAMAQFLLVMGAIRYMKDKTSKR